MERLRREDLLDIVEQVAGDWEFRHHGLECSHNLTIEDFDRLEEGAGLFELQLIRYLPQEA